MRCPTKLGPWSKLAPGGRSHCATEPAPGPGASSRRLHCAACGTRTRTRERGDTHTHTLNADEGKAESRCVAATLRTQHAQAEGVGERGCEAAPRTSPLGGAGHPPHSPLADPDPPLRRPVPVHCAPRHATAIALPRRAPSPPSPSPSPSASPAAVWGAAWRGARCACACSAATASRRCPCAAASRARLPHTRAAAAPRPRPPPRRSAPARQQAIESTAEGMALSALIACHWHCMRSRFARQTPNIRTTANTMTIDVATASIDMQLSGRTEGGGQRPGGQIRFDRTTCVLAPTSAASKPCTVPSPSARA